jgi:hypothetical protein
METIVLSDTIKTIPSNCFNSSGSDIILGKGITFIGDEAFLSSGIKVVDFSKFTSDTISLGSGAFGMCNLDRLVITDAVTLTDRSFGAFYSGSSGTTIKEFYMLCPSKYSSLDNFQPAVANKRPTIGTLYFNGSSISSSYTKNWTIGSVVLNVSQVVTE